MSSNIGLVGNLFSISGSDAADHAQLQWATTLKADNYTLYRSSTPEDGFVPVYQGAGTSWDDNNMELGTEIVTTLFEDQYREFPNLIKRNGYYFLFTSQAAGWYPSSGAYSVTDDLYGDWSELRMIGNTSTFSSQSGWIVNLKDRNYLMHAYRWVKGTGTSGTTLCPLYFDNGFAFYDYCPSFLYST